MYEENFWRVLFDDEDSTCFSVDQYGINAFSVKEKHNGARFFSINALNGPRRDANVSKYRNFLIEFDSIPLPEQATIMENVPHSTCVFSGSKSYHYIISLEQPCKDKSEYDSIMDAILKKLPDADRTSKNPSRFSRCPNVWRDNGQRQHLVYARNRVSLESLLGFLGLNTPPQPKKREKPWKPTKGPRLLKGMTQYFLDFGASGEFDGKWNMHLFLATLDMARAGYNEDEIFSRMEGITGSLDNSDERTIKSALKTAKEESAS